MRRTLITLTTVAILGVPRLALACPVCFGQTNSPLASATNMGIIAMLVVVAGVLSGFASFIIYLNRRARLMADGVGQAAMGQAGLTTSTPQEGIAQC